MGKQKLSPGARKTKAARDCCYAKGWKWNPYTNTCSKNGKGKNTSIFNRKAKKAENQRIGQNSTSDIHHVNGQVGNTKRVSIASNRDTFKNGDRKKKKKTTKK